MLKRFVLGAALAATLLPAIAYAASVNFAIIFNSPASTSVACTPGGPFVVPTAAGTQVATCVVSPSTWTGSLALSGTGAAQFVVGGSAPNFTVSVGASPITLAQTFNLTATSNP